MTLAQILALWLGLDRREREERIEGGREHVIKELGPARSEPAQRHHGDTLLLPFQNQSINQFSV